MKAKRSGKSYRIQKAFENQTGYVWKVEPHKTTARWNRNNPFHGRIHIQYEVDSSYLNPAWFMFNSKRERDVIIGLRKLEKIHEER